MTQESDSIKCEEEWITFELLEDLFHGSPHSFSPSRVDWYNCKVRIK